MTSKHVAPKSEDKKYCVPFCSLKDGKWIACDNMACPVEWFHCECVEVDPSNIPSGDWLCPPCADGLNGVKPKKVLMSNVNDFTEDSLEEINQKKREIEKEIAREELKVLSLQLNDTRQRSQASRPGPVGISPREFERLLGRLSNDHGIPAAEGKLHPRSGLYEVARHQVRYTQEWPHKNLDMEYSSQVVNFKDLKMPQFVAGELNIIRNSNDESERKVRLEFLQALMYEAIACKKLPLILDCYSGWLLEIERGRRLWGDDFSGLINSIVRRASYSFMQPGYRAEERVGYGQYSGARFLWYCSDYNRGNCDKESPHQSAMKIKGVVREVVHMCATCYNMNKTENHHPEHSTECPLKDDTM